MKPNTDTAAVSLLVERIKPLLSGLPPDVQGAALADLLAIWLAGHVISNDAAATDEMREAILQMHIEIVRRLIPINVALRADETKH